MIHIYVPICCRAGAKSKPFTRPKHLLPLTILADDFRVLKADSAALGSLEDTKPCHFCNSSLILFVIIHINIDPQQSKKPLKVSKKKLLSHHYQLRDTALMLGKQSY